MGKAPEYTLMKAEGRVGVFDVYGFEKVVPALLKLEVAKVWIGVDILPVFSGEYVVRGADGLCRTIDTDKVDFFEIISPTCLGSIAGMIISKWRENLSNS